MPQSLAILDQDKTFHFIVERSMNIWADDHMAINHFYSAEQLITYLLENSDESEKMPAVMLVELDLVPIDGWEFFDHFSRIKDLLITSPKVIATSSSHLAAHKAAALAHDCVTWYLEKPITDQKFKIIKDLIDGRTTKQQLLNGHMFH